MSTNRIKAFFDKLDEQKSKPDQKTAETIEQRMFAAMKHYRETGEDLEEDVPPEVQEAVARLREQGLNAVAVRYDINDLPTETKETIRLMARRAWLSLHDARCCRCAKRSGMESQDGVTGTLPPEWKLYRSGDMNPFMMICPECHAHLKPTFEGDICMIGPFAVVIPEDP